VYSHYSPITDDLPPTTTSAIEALQRLPKNQILPLSSLYYQVKVTHPVTAKYCFYNMLIDTGASRSGIPNAFTRLGIEAGGFENTRTHSGQMKSPCGLVHMQLESRAIIGEELDKIGQPTWRYEPLPEFLKSLKTSSPLVVSKLDGLIPHVGLNTLLAWNVSVHPEKGLIANN